MEKLESYKDSFIKFINDSDSSRKEEINNFFEILEKSKTIVGVEEYNNVKKEEILFLDLSNQQLETLPVGIENLDNILALDLSNNKNLKLDGIGKLKNLKTLFIENCELKNIPNEINKLESLFSINLNNNNLSNLPDGFNKLKIVGINISNNHFINIPENLLNIASLKGLFAGNNKIKQITENIKELKNLIYLEVENNEISEFNYDNFTKLINLNLSYNKISDLPKEIGNLKQLTNLNFFNNNLITLPKEIGKLTNLKNLLLDGNNLEEYPVELADLKKLDRIYLLGTNSNPLSKMIEAKDLGIIELMDYLNKRRGVYKYSTLWDVPNELKTGFQQYLNFFSDFVKKLTGEDIVLNVHKIESGLQLVAETSLTFSISDIDSYLIKFVDLFVKQNEDLISKEEANKLDRQKAFELRQLVRDLGYENQNLNRKIQDYYENILFLSDNLEKKNEAINELKLEIRFFKKQNTQLLELSIAQNERKFDINVSVIQSLPESKYIDSTPVFNPDKFRIDLIQKAIRLAEKKGVEKIEDIHNNDFVSYLRDHHYFATDQTQSGISNVNYGELDIMIRKSNGTPICIIEAFKLASAGKKNKEISKHINKLIHKYDTIGHQTNFIIVYANASNFKKLWDNYVVYVQDLNNKPDFEDKYKLLSFVDTANGAKANLRIGLALHEREGMIVKVYHLFIDMYSAVNKP